MSEQPFTVHRCVKRCGTTLPLHAHQEAQLTFAASGMVQVHTGEGRWLIPSQLAVWVPEGVLHRVEVLSDAELWMVHWMPSAIKKWVTQPPPPRAFALRVTPLLAAAFAPGGGSGPGKSELLVRLMLHELTETVDAPTFLPMPASPEGRRVADLALSDPRNRLSLGELASRAATSVRTVSRLFPAETGLTFKAWRQRARIVCAMDRLARGDTIGGVSADLGFASTAAFSCAFRQVTAMSPTTFLGRPGLPTARPS